MPDQTEIQIMNDRMNSLNDTVVRGIEASEQVALSVNNLLVEFRERDVRHEYERVAHEQLEEKVDALTMTINNHVDFVTPPLLRAKKSQERWDSFVLSMSTTTGKLSIGIILAGIAVFFGLDPRNFFKGP